MPRVKLTKSQALARLAGRLLKAQTPGTYGTHKGDRSAITAFRNRLILEAHRAGLSQNKTAKLLGVSQSLVCKILGDHRWGYDVTRARE